MKSFLVTFCLAVCQLAAASSGPAMSPTTDSRLQASPTASGSDSARQATSRARVVVFFERGFPSADAVAPDGDALRAALAAFDVALADATALPAALDDERTMVLVLPFGSAFPQPAWPAISRYLSRGGSLVNLGGVPFAQPVAGDQGSWRLLRRTTAYHKQLGIVQAFPVDASGLVYRDAPGLEYRGDEVLAREAVPRRIYELMVRLTDAKTFPDEDGSDGPREARLDPVVYAYRGGEPGSANSPQLPVAAPFVRIDRLRGPYAGGRWVLATGDGAVSPAGITWLVGLATRGPHSLRVQPRFAGFHPGEPLRATVVYERPGRTLSADGGSCTLTVADSAGSQVAHFVESLPINLPNAGWRSSADVTIPLNSAELRRGRYTITAAVDGVKAVNGFWVYDDAMVRGGRPLTTSRDYFVRGGQPFPVAGTTYMATDVHRRFLLEPNPPAWARDFAQMAAAGVNTVRTGIWTGWRLHSSSDGTPTEAMLRALEVFVLTAREHDMPVIFNLFAFVPPTWDAGQVNPYFAPGALAAQKRFAGAIAGRLAGADDISWDLINEPSFSSPERLWSCRPNYDADEQAAWDAWIRETVGPSASASALEGALLDRWNAPAGEGLALPRLEDFGDKNLFAATRPNKAADYKRFAQASFTRWVRQISGAIRTSGNRALITVGQDEGGATERPNPLMFGDAVDFTGTHTWWNNDALLWDALVSKRSDKPSLVGETGLMTYEQPDGDSWRTETEAHNLLERKLALAFAGGAAGFVQWLWNTNVYMPIDNEAGIGLLRADGTAKPEFEAFVRLTAFVARHREVFRNRVPEDVVVVVPQSQLFSVRDFATAATQRAVRTLEYGLHLPVRVVNELAIGDLQKGGRVLIVPSPRTLTEPAWRALLAAADAGATVLVTGPIDRDEYERPVGRLAALGIAALTRPVAPVNSLKVGTVQLAVPFGGSKLERLERAVVSGGPTAGDGAGAPGAVVTIARGKGRVVWCPLPVELSDDEAATSAVYREALRTAGVPLDRVTAPAGVLVRPLVFERSTLLVVVNETDADATISVRLAANANQAASSVRIAADRAVMVLVDRRTGQILDSSQ